MELTKEQQDELQELRDGYKVLNRSFKELSNAMERMRHSLDAANESTIFWQKAYRKLSVEHRHLVDIIKKDGKGLNKAESLTTFLISEGKYGHEG